MTLAVGTISTYKLYNAINSIIEGDYGYNRITINSGNHANEDQVVIDGVTYYIYDLLSGKGLLTPAALYEAGNNTSANNIRSAVNWQTGQPIGTEEYIADTEHPTSTVISMGNPLIFRTKTVGTASATTSTTNATRYTVYSASMLGGREVSGIPALLGASGEYGPEKLEQASTFPTLSYSLVVADPYNDKSGTSGMIQFRVQFDCLATDHDDCHLLLAEVQETFDQFSGDFYRFEDGYKLTIEKVIYDRAQSHPYDHTLEVYHSSIDFHFYLKETAL